MGTTNSPCVLIETHTSLDGTRTIKSRGKANRKREEEDDATWDIRATTRTRTTTARYYYFLVIEEEEEYIIKKSWHRRTTRIRARKRTKENPSLALSGDVSPRVERCFQTRTFNRGAGFEKVIPSQVYEYGGKALDGATAGVSTISSYFGQAILQRTGSNVSNNSSNNGGGNGTGTSAGSSSV